MKIDKLHNAPKVKETEDERIRKEIMSYIKSSGAVTNKQWIAWLEKQRKIVDEYEDNLDRCACENFNKGYKAAIEHQKEKQGKQEEPQIYEAKDGEIITYSETKGYKVFKPKFHEGEWIIQKNVGIYKVIEVCETWYEVVDNKDNHYSIGFDKEYMCRPWTINDAKDGDVLASNLERNYISPFIAVYKSRGLDFFSSYCFIGLDGKFYKGDTGHDIIGIHPATKEQRDLLFQKIKEAGYEWHKTDKGSFLLLNIS